MAPISCGRGLGRAMLASAIRRLALIPGCGRIRLLIDPRNLVARQLYASFGFAAEGVSRLIGEFILARAINCGGMVSYGRRSMRWLSLRRRMAAERSPTRVCAVWGTVLPGRSPPP